MHCKFIDVPLLYYGQQHVSTTQLAFFRVISFGRRTQL